MPFGHSFRVTDSFDEAPGPSFAEGPPSLPSAFPTTGLQAFYDNSETSMPADGSAWNDISGNNKHYSQAISTSRPTVISSGIGGLRCYEFAGGGSQNDFFLDTTADWYNFGGQAGMTMIMVNQRRSSITTHHRIFTVEKDIADGNNSVYWFGLAYQNGDFDVWHATTRHRAYNIPALGNGTGPESITFGLMQHGNFSGESFGMVARTNGIVANGDTLINESATGPTLDATVQQYIGNNAATDTQGCPDAHWIAELVVYNRALTVSEVNDIQSYYATKYSISATPWTTYNT